MDVCEQDFDLAACGEEFGDFEHGDEVAAVGFSCCCGAPVDSQGAFGGEDYVFYYFGGDDFLEVVLN